MKKRIFKILLIIAILLCSVSCEKTHEGEEYKLSYIVNGELVELNPQSYISGESINLPTLERKDFEGWYLDSEFKNKIDVNDKNLNGNKILYAHFIDLEYEIKYYLNEDELDIEPKNYKYGNKTNLPILENINNKIFEGWYLESNFITKVDAIFETDYNNKTLYAKYVENGTIDASNAKRLNDAIKEVNNGKGIERGIPSIGNPKVLVIPVDFTDYKADKNMKTNLEKAFFGTSEDTGWESLKSYYEKSSYGNLSINGIVTDVYSTNKKSSYYNQDENRIYEIIQAALTYFDNTINYDEFDLDKDGYIDCVYIIYSCPVNYEDDDSIWWAFTDQYFTEDYEYYDNVEADYFVFAGYDFLFEDLSSKKDVKLNCETIIHETGHALGLDDYYDYDDSDRKNQGGLGGFDMMDENIGDHNAFSKSILGWITPDVIETKNLIGSVEISLKPFEDYGDAIVIAKDFNNSFYSEYYIIQYYTPTKLNAIEAGECGLFNKSGILLLHVSAYLSDKEIDCVWDMTVYNNANSKYKLIKLVEADGYDDISKGEYSTNNDLYKANQIINNLYWNDGSSVGVSIKIGSLGEDTTITISK